MKTELPDSFTSQNPVKSLSLATSLFNTALYEQPQEENNKLTERYKMNKC